MKCGIIKAMVPMLSLCLVLGASVSCDQSDAEVGTGRTVNPPTRSPVRMVIPEVKANG